MKHALAWFALLPVSVLVASGCSPANVMGTGGSSATSSSGAGASPSTAAVDATCRDYAFTYCARLAACGPTVIDLAYGTTSLCEKLVGDHCAIVLLAPDVATTIATQTACQDALGNWSCSDIIVGTNPPPACAFIAGTRASGSPCGIDAQCSSGFCSGLSHGLCGVCAAPPAAGDSCATDFCASGYVCHGSPPTCVQYSGQAGPCSASIPCADGLTCVAASCQPGSVGLGSSCTPTPTGAGCDPYQGFSCDAATNTCAQVKLAQNGQACGVVGTDTVSCSAGECLRGACVSHPLPGSPCEMSGATCIASSHCIADADGSTTGTCRLTGSMSCD